MTDGQCWHPDLLRRFVPTPYVFKMCVGTNQICVESNDLEIALGLRQSDAVVCLGHQTGGLLCKVIRDGSAPMDDAQRLIVSDGRIRALYQGRGTILIYDHERAELLGFVARNVKVQELVRLLIPALLDEQGAQRVGLAGFTKK